MGFNGDVGSKVERASDQHDGEPVTVPVNVPNDPWLETLNPWARRPFTQ
jgi:hypothetical protein